MALTVTEITRTKTATAKVAVLSVTFDSSYPTGGEAFDAAMVGMSRIIYCSPATTGANDVVFDAANNKLKAFVSSSAAEVTDTTNLSTLTVPLLVIGH